MAMRPDLRSKKLGLLVAVLAVAHMAAAAPVVGQPAGRSGDAAPADPGPPLPGGPLGFLENGGQLDREVHMYAWTPGGGVALATGGSVVTLVDGDAGLGCNVRIDFVGAPTAVPGGREALPGVTSHIRGDDPARWGVGLTTYREAVYEDLWEGIDLVYRVSEGRVKYDLVLAPGTDTADARFRLSGHEAATIDPGGDLVVTTVAGVLRDEGLVARYADGAGETVDCAFELLDGDTYGFRLEGRDPSRPVVVDPLVYSTYVGGGAGLLEEPTAGIALDDAGRALVAGQTNTTDFPVTTGAFQTSNAGGDTDLFVFRLSADGSDLEWSTYLGGTNADYPYSIAADGSGRAVVVGRTNSTDLPTTAGSFDPTHSGDDHEGFLLKLNGQGTDLVYSTYLGGNGTDELVDVALDGTGNVYVAGNTLSPDLPASAGAAFPNLTGRSFDAFVARLSPDGSTLVDLTYLGGTKWDVALSIDLDDRGAVYVGGETISTDFPATNGSFQDFLVNNLTRDGFVVKLDPGLGSLAWASYVGGLFDDFVEFVRVGPNGTVYAAGDTESAGFPVTNGSYQTLHQGAIDTFILRMSSNGSRLEFCTFLGGAEDDYCEGLSVNATGVATVVGSTLSGDFPTIKGVQQEARGGKYDAYLFRLEFDGATATYSTYLGGTEWDLANGLAMDDGGDAYIAGATDSLDLPTTSGAYQEAHGGRVDVFCSRLDLFLDRERPVSRPGTDMVVDQHATVHFDGSASTDNVGVVNWTWELTYDGVDHLFYGPTFNWTFDLAGKYYVYLTVRDAVDLVDRQWVSVYVNDTEPPVAIAPDDLAGQQHWTVTLDGGASHDNVEVTVYTWTFAYGGENVTLTGQRVDFTFDEAGVFRITLTVEDAFGNDATDNMTVTIVDTTPPDLVIGEEDIRVDQGTRVRFNASASTDNVRITNITWQFAYAGAPIVLYGHTPDFTFSRAGTYSVTVTAEDGNGNRAFGDVRVTVTDVTPPVAVAGSDVTIDQGEVVDLDASGSSDNAGIVDWRWSVDLGGETSNFSGVSNAFTFIAAGTFNVTLVVEDAAGNTGTDSFVVRVRDITPPEAVAGESLVIGQGETVVFNGTDSTDNVGIVSYSWVLSMGAQVERFSTPSFEHRFDRVGNYLLTLQVFDGSGLSDTDELNVAVLDTEPPVAEAGPDVEVDLDDTVRLDGSASTDNVGVASWTWTFNYNQEEQELAGADPSFTFQLRGTYVVTLTVSDEAGNTHQDTVSVTVVSDGGGGGGNGGGGGGGLLAWVAVAIVLAAVVVALALVTRGGGDRGEEEEEDDMGWTPTEEEKRARNDVVDDEGEEGADDGDGPGDAGDRRGV